jgi:hypothetical protein
MIEMLKRHEVQWRRRALLRHKRETHAIDRRTDRELHVVEDQRPVHGDRDGLVALVEFSSTPLSVE